MSTSSLILLKHLKNHRVFVNVSDAIFLDPINAAFLDLTENYHGEPSKRKVLVDKFLDEIKEGFLYKHTRDYINHCNEQ